MRERTVDEIVELGQLFRLPLAALGNGATIREMDHLQERGVYVDNPAGFAQPRPPWLMSVAAPSPMRTAPAIGDSDTESLWEPRQSTADTGRPGDPLAGLRVVDFTAFWAGPSATHSLAAFGADVIKIESIQRPGRHPLLGRDAQGRRRLVGVRLGVPRDEHQQALGHARPAVRRRPAV